MRREEIYGSPCSDRFAKLRYNKLDFSPNYSAQKKGVHEEHKFFSSQKRDQRLISFCLSEMNQPLGKPSLVNDSWKKPSVILKELGSLNLLPSDERLGEVAGILGSSYLTCHQVSLA